MATFERCDESVKDLAASILFEFETHRPLIDQKVTIDYVFAYAETDDNGEPVGDAITKGGVRCLGLCRKVSLKDRALGRADAEITLDGDFWKTASEPEQRAILDHELHHIEVKTDKKTGAVMRDDLGRPKLRLRAHDVEVGWFALIAARHGRSSIECKQAKWAMDNFGQAFWPALVPLT